MKILKVFFFLILCFSIRIFAQDIYINEFLASNISTNADMIDFGDFSDWIEIYNNENNPVNIGGYYISDDPFIPGKWQFPANTIIAAKGFLLIWADDFNNIPGQIYVREWWPHNINYTTLWNHTNFKLDKDGDFIGLYTNTGLVIDSLFYDNQKNDVSFGRKPDGANTWFYFGEPSPMASNTGLALNEPVYSGEVKASLSGGFFESDITVSLNSSTGQGTIRYTLDGSNPGSNSSVYNSPLYITSNTILKARLFEDSKLAGKILTNSYFINENRTLPAFSLVGDNHYILGHDLGIYRNTLKEREIPIHMEYFPLNDDEIYKSGIGMRIGGENIYRFAQKPLNLYARSKYGNSHIEYKMFENEPYDEFKRLYLRNSGDDWPNTMIKDGLLVTILKDHIGNSMQAYKPSVVYLNGMYWGIHNIREKIDEHYFLLHHNVTADQYDHLESNNQVINGDSTDYVELLSYVNANDLSVTENYAYVKSKIDIHNFMDFIIVQDYLANTSWGHNREIWRDKSLENKWRWIIVDMDRGFNNNNISTDLLFDLYNDFELFRALLDNQSFVDEFVQRYAYHINNTFNSARVVAIIDSLQTNIAAEMPRHINKWGTYIDSLSIDDWGQTSGISSLNSWDSQIQNLKDFANQRVSYVTQYLSGRFNLSGSANLHLTSNVGNTGKVSINNSFYNFGTDHIYFKDIPLQISAYAPPGYIFTDWKEILTSNSLTIIPSGAEWKYYDLSSEPSGDWKAADFNDAGWSTGKAQLGYGDGDENTVIGYGGNTQNKYMTSYYRHEFTVDNLADFKELKLRLLRDDGAVVYINGEEVVQDNMPAGAVSFSTPASQTIGGGDESTFYEFTIDKSNLVNGTNIIAVEIHQSTANSSDVSFDLGLYGIFENPRVIENSVSSNPSISYSINTDTELIAEFTQVNSNSVPGIISSNLTLSAENSPYYLTENVLVNSDAVLTVDAGVEILFSAKKDIRVKGRLLINGTAENKVTLTSYYPSDNWGAVIFENSNAVSEINHANISKSAGQNNENFFAAVSSINSSVQLNNVHFNNISAPISSQYSDMIIDNCFFENVTQVGDYINCNGGNIQILNCTFIGNGLPNMDGIDLGQMTQSTYIKNNIIHDFKGYNNDGIDIGEASENVQIENNIIYNCYDKGVSVGQGSQVVLKNNFISRCNLAVGIKDSLSHADIINNTFYDNTVATAVYEKNESKGGGSAHIVNTILANSKEASFTVDDLSEIEINFSLSNTDTLPGINNLYTEPWLINPKDNNFMLQVNSAAINNGDPASPYDADGSPADIGAISYKGNGNPVIVINEINYNSSDSLNSEDWLELYNNSSSAIDLKGWVFMDETHNPSFAFEDNYMMDAKSCFVICKEEILFSTFFPDVDNYVGNMKNRLDGNGEALFLYNNLGQLVDSLTYNDKAPWPLQADGNGPTLELQNPGFDNGLAENWSASLDNGTPGQQNSQYVVALEPEENILPGQFALLQNYPNPFNPVTTISYTVKIHNGASPHVDLSIYNLLGQKVATLVNQKQPAGNYTVEWDATDFATGIYIYTLETSSGFKKSRKLVLLK